MREASSPQKNEVDVLVVGAGFAGLSAAKAYLQCDPQAELLVVDNGQSLGGTWAKERLYPQLRSNNLLGTFEFPDFPLHKGFGVREGEHIPGEILHRYLCEYASTFGIEPRLRLRTKVISAERPREGQSRAWRVILETWSGEIGATEQRTILVSKLIVATGLTSQSEPSHLLGQKSFAAPIISLTQLAATAYSILDRTDGQRNRVTVIGGSKSSYDAVYLFASRGFSVNWVIRKSGYGPSMKIRRAMIVFDPDIDTAWMAPSHMKIGPRYFRLEQLASVRLMSWFSPCIWGERDGLEYWARWLLHKTRLGRWLTDRFWTRISNDTVEQSGLLKHPELKRLVPDENAFWYATGLAVLNYPTNIHDFVVSGQVKMHRQDIAYLSKNTVHLSDGTVLESSAGLVANANWAWKPNITFLPTTLHSDLGIPSLDYTPDQKVQWATMDARADAEVLSSLPRLRSVPHRVQEANDTIDTKQLGPLRHFRFIAPPGLTASGDRSIVFAGFAANLLGHTRNEIAGLWIYAYLNNKLAIDQPVNHSKERPSKQPKQPDFAYEAALANRYCVQRFPYGFGARFPDFVFEQVAFFDLLLRDLGLKERRKRSWWREIFEPYGPSDYRGLTDEWLAVQKKKV